MRNWIGGSWRSDSSTATGTSVAVGLQRATTSGRAASVQQQVGDEVPGRLVAADEEEHELGAGLDVGEAAAVDLGLAAAG